MTETATPVCLKVEGGSVATALERATDNMSGDVVLDFSPVQRLDTSAIRALEQMAYAAHAKNVKVTLRGVNVALYKVLKLVRLSRRFSFES